MKRENFINLYNSDGQKHGVWESYYENGQLRYRGNFVNGKKHGVFEYYYGSDKLSHRVNYANGIEHGAWESYLEDGQLNYRKEYNMGEEVQPIIELTLDEIAEKFKIPVSQLKIKTQ